MPSSRQTARILDSIPREMSEYSICRSAIGCTRWARRSVSAPASERPTWRTWPACTKVGNCADRFLDRNVRVDTGRPVDVHVIGSQPRQRMAEEVLHGLRAAVVAEDPAVVAEDPAVVAEDPAVGIAHYTELHAQQDL